MPKKKSSTPQQGTQQAPAPATAPANGTAPARGNAAANQMTKGAAGKAPPVNVGQVQDSNGFMRAASGALNAALPSNGSFCSLKVTGTIPLYSDPTGTTTITMSPSLELQAARSETGEFEVTIGSSLSLTAKAGKSLGWLGKFEAYLTGKVRGSLKIAGDSASEIMSEFMLMVRETIAGACSACGVPNDIASKMTSGVMSNAAREQTIKGMDKNDGVTATFGVGGEVGGKWGNNSASAGIEYTKTAELKNTNGDNQLEVTSKGQTAVTVKGSFKPKRLPVKSITPSVTFIFSGGGLSEVFVGLGTEGEMKAGAFKDIALMGTDWAVDFVMAIKGLIQDAGRKSGRSEVARISELAGGLSLSNEAVKYTAFGNQLKSWANSPSFGGQSEQKISFAASAQAGWSKKKSWNAKGAITSSTSWKLGGGSSPLQIEAKSGQTIASFKR